MSRGIFLHTCIPIALSVAMPVMAHAATPSPWQEPDLNPVTFRSAPSHPSVVLIGDGRTNASICLVDLKSKPAARELQTCIKLATGISLPIIEKKVIPPAIVIGDCAEALACGLAGSNMPPEGFAIKTAPDLVFITGNNGGLSANGNAWGIYEFLERFVGMRWYFPQAVTNGPDIGLDIPKIARLEVPPVWIEDAPVFRMREIFPPCSNPWQGTGIDLKKIQTFLRAGNSWPNKLRVHQPNWAKDELLKRECPEVFQLKKDGSREYDVLCYGNPKTLEIYLKGIENFIAKKKPFYAPISGKAITISPADVELACYCADCRKLWDEKGGQYGAASKVMATFTDRLAREVLKRWPTNNYTILLLPYLNYTTAPDGFKFPGNVEIQLCGMPGMANYKEPAIRDAEQFNIDRWIAMTCRKIQNWHYNVWPAHKTKAAYHYPHVVKDFYVRNLDKTVGTFINGDYNHWPRQQISMYCWLKVLWNPAFNVDAAIDTYARRMFGNAGVTVRKLLELQIRGWEDSRWPGGMFSPKGIYEQSFPPARIKEMKALIDKAFAEAKGDELVTARLNYIVPSIRECFVEADMLSGVGFKPLHAQKVGENPVIDGRLDEPGWARAPANTFVVATGKSQGKPATYPTELKALWTPDGITLGFKMTEPTPDKIYTANGGHDNGGMWWDDNVEFLIDSTGQQIGDYYQFMVNAAGDYWDSHMRDATWECKGMQIKTSRGPDFWCAEVFIPYAAFPNTVKPGSGTHTKWAGNFTRHRVADCNLKANKKEVIPGSVREYQRMNTTGATASDNLADFSFIEFIE